MRPPDTTPEAAEVQLRIYRRMSPGDRLRQALELTGISRRLLAAGVRRRHPEYDDEQVRLATIRIWLGDELYGAAYPEAPELEP